MEYQVILRSWIESGEQYTGFAAVVKDRYGEKVGDIKGKVRWIRGESKSLSTSALVS